MLVSNLAAQRLADDPEGPMSTGAGHEITTKRRLCHQRTCGLRTRKYRSGVLERLRAPASTRRWRRRLLPVPSWTSFCLECADGPDQQGICGAVGSFCQATTGSRVQFRKGERKDDVAVEYLKKFKGEEGVLFIGKAQEKSRVFRTERRCNSKTGATYPWLTRSTAMVNNFYIYCVD